MKAAIISNKTNWDLKVFFESIDDPKIEQNLEKVKKESNAFVKKWSFNNNYLKDPLTLKMALDEYDKLNTFFGTDGEAGYYIALKSYLDQSDAKVKAKYNKINEISIKILNDIQFFELKLSKLPLKTQKAFLKASILKPYKHYLETTFATGAHRLSDQEEKILNLMHQTAFSNWVMMTAEFIAREEKSVISDNGKKEKVSFSEITKRMNSPIKAKRDEAAKIFNSIQKKYVDVAEKEMNSILQVKKVEDELRNFTRPDEARILSDEINTDFIDSLIKAVENRNDISKRYYEFKAKMLKQKTLAYHERNVEYGEINTKYSYEQAMDIVHNVFKNLDPEFEAILQNYLSNGQVDVFPKKGKYNGAFSIHNLRNQPGFVLLNFTGILDDVTTIAHEFGHAIHGDLSRKNQHSFYIDLNLATGEVASTFIEDYVLEKLIEKSADEERLAIYMGKLNGDISSTFRQIACYKFELELHKEFRQTGYLRKTQIGQLFTKHMSEYMGRAVEQSNGTENWWVYWSHIREFFYVYSYASGSLISKALQSKVKKDKKFVREIKKFLSAGVSDTPINIFKGIGVDITNVDFWSSGLDEIELLLEDTMALAKKLKKI